LCTAIREVETALANPIEKSDNSRFVELKGIFEKSLAVNRNMNEGEIIKVEDLEGKKPKGFGLDASIFRSIIGKKLNKDLKKWSFLKEEDISDGEA
jgi:N-acetylneuraminate synthase